MEYLADLTFRQLAAGGVAIAALLSIFIEITPVKINPVSTFLAWLGKKLTGDIKDEIATIKEDIKTMQADCAEKSAIDCRCRILRFGDEISHQTPHSQEHFEQILEDIDTYDRYCTSHPLFKNNKTCVTSKLILDTYEKCKKANKFF